MHLYNDNDNNSDNGNNDDAGSGVSRKTSNNNKKDGTKLHGRSAIEAAHNGVTSQDEAGLDTMISNLYGVESEEAAEIHTNYHLNRISQLKGAQWRTT